MHFIVDETPESDIKFLQARIKFFEKKVKEKDSQIGNLESKVMYWKTENAKLNTKITILQSKK